MLGAGLVALGIRTRRKEIRLAALGVVALATLKLFLVDMDALVGLGAICRRFMMTAPAAPAALADSDNQPR